MFTSAKINSMPRLLATIIVGVAVIGYWAKWDATPVVTIFLIAIILPFSLRPALLDIEADAEALKNLEKTGVVLLWSAASAAVCLTVWSGYLIATKPAFLNFTCGVAGILLAIVPIKGLLIRSR
ncbi:hypothetical protein OK351_04495 [Glutamicibacter sp. MNS18]|uniref:hypothetical protein n=1 Tax=Glutamicibacter sp. MNS18 TaxID=2989817 RepID=UPI002235FB54|nr:hypothetical protein [Glutamicibacter sp. MNS18]MCW4464764.1 hypothetical protein [Glutamicibacter sp. MNS18]